MRKAIYLASMLILSASFYLFAGTDMFASQNQQKETYHKCPYLQQAYEKGCPAFKGESGEASKTRFEPGKAL